MEKETLLPMKVRYKLNEEQQHIVDRMLEELTHRLKTSQVELEIYTENHLIAPVLNAQHVTFELSLGRFKSIHQISEMELAKHSEIFFMFTRRLLEQALSEAMIRGVHGYQPITNTKQ